VRGGGSLEDLWAFNTEVVARAIERCPLPVIAGVGHETDLTIADLVSDLRAPTPSAAAEQAFADRSEAVILLQRDWRRLVGAMRSRLGQSQQRLERQRGALRLLSPAARLETRRRNLSAAALALGRAMVLLGERRRSALAHRAGQLDSLSPLAVLGRGYGLVTRARDGAIVRRADEIEIGETVDVRLGRGRLGARVESRQEEPD
jgi:exodeoxyribonuclease VII large subunit